MDARLFLIPLLGALAGPPGDEAPGSRRETIMDCNQVFARLAPPAPGSRPPRTPTAPACSPTCPTSRTDTRS